MATSYVAVGTVMYMITDGLTCRPQKRPCRSGAPVPLLVPCFLARAKPLLVPRRSMWRSTGEPAVPGVSASAAGSTAGLPMEKQPAARPSYTISPAGQRLKRSRPAVGAAQAVGRQKKAPPGCALQRGQSWDMSRSRLIHCRTANEFRPLRSVTQADSA